MFYHQSLTASSAAYKTAPTTCPTGRWRYAPHLQLTRELTLSGTPERNVFFPRVVVALLIYRVPPNTLRRRLNRAGPPCRTRGSHLPDGPARARRGENTVPKHSGERVERPRLHPHTPDRRAAAPARAFLGQNACCTASCHHALRTGGADDSLNATGHEGGIGRRM
jgi:hypothetical protein